MKILKLRGANLASLADEFEIDFERPPLSNAGLFVITGPTGAGKSTLLDAMCVALFDRTPRLSDRGGVLVGDADREELRLSSNDVRSLLRHGAASAYAEVEFLGVDGRRYSARWSVRRAHNQPDGRLQAQDVQLKELPHLAIVGRTKQETLDAIRQKLGLSFDQFRRSVLLAQGDFAAFLKADAKERAELLEKMTGTEIYARLSIGAHQRSRSERASLEDLQTRLGHIAVMDPGQRVLREQERAASQAALADVSARLQESTRAVAWFDVLARLTADEIQARDRANQASQRRNDAEALRRELIDAAAVEHLRTSLHVAERAEADLRQARASVAATEVAHNATREALRQRRVAAATAEASLAEAQEREATSQPLLAAARNADAKVQSAAAELNAATQTVTQSDGQLRAAKASVDEAEQKHIAARLRVDAETEWASAHATDEGLAASWDRTRDDLARWREHRRSESQARQDLSRADRAVQEIELILRTTTESCERAQSDHADEEVALQSMRRNLDEADVAGLRARLKAASEQQSRLMRLEGLASQAAAFLEDERRARGEEAEATHLVQESQAALKESTADLAALVEPIRSAEKELEDAKAVRDLGQRRTDLRVDEACPLCGSTTHPWAEHAPERPVGALEATLKTLLSQRQGAENRRTGAETRIEAATRKAEGARATLARAADRLASLAADWTEVRGADADIPEDPSASSAKETTVSLARGINAEVLQLEARVAGGEALQKDLDASRRRLDQRADSLKSLQEVVRSHERQRNSLILDRQQFAGAAEAAQRNAASTIEQLARSFANRDGWQAALTASPEGFEESCRTAVEQWRTHRAGLESSRAALASLEETLHASRGALNAREEAHTLHRTRYESARQADDRSVSERRSLFDGRATAEVEAELRGSVGRSLAAATEAREVSARAAEVMASASAHQDAARDREESCARDADVAGATLRAGLGAVGLELEVVRTRLQRDALWRSQSLALVAERDRDFEQAQVRLTERERLRREHEDRDAPVLTKELAAATVETATREISATQEALVRARSQLAQDDDHRAQADELRSRIPLQQATADRWATLSSLIGSSDGSVFRRFAQSLTLDAMLVQSNEHLAQLVPRYRLARIPGEELDLQVIDLDMGGDIRTINTLSGGESFLVSLALALGLSSLSAQGTGIESLFIDEGFGFLDQNSLELALSTLDGLQASGRQVGLVSHVPGLADRIGVRVRVAVQNVGRSRVEVRGAG